MSVLKLLIIEDADSQLMLYEDTIQQMNSSKGICIEYELCKSFEQGKAALLSPGYDAAIIDLKLSQSPELEGIDLVERVYNKMRIPIFVVSGSIPQIDHIPDNALFKKRKRTDDFESILNEIIDIYKTGITSFLRPGGVLDGKLSEIFWTNLASDLGIWIKQNNENTLLRYILTHFLEHLDITIEGDLAEYHPSEVYIKPPIKKNIHTGELIKLNNSYYLILTPACDITIQEYKQGEDGSLRPLRKSEQMMLAKIKEFDLNAFCKTSKGNVDKGKITEYVQNKHLRYHYLPPFNSNKGFLVDFQDLKSIDYNSSLERIASISAPFIKDIISRFSNYYSRQGQPTFGQKAIIENLYSMHNEKA